MYNKHLCPALLLKQIFLFNYIYVAATTNVIVLSY